MPAKRGLQLKEMRINYIEWKVLRKVYGRVRNEFDGEHQRKENIDLETIHN